MRNPPTRNPFSRTARTERQATRTARDARFGIQPGDRESFRDLMRRERADARTARQTR